VVSALAQRPEGQAGPQLLAGPGGRIGVATHCGAADGVRSASCAGHAGCQEHLSALIEVALAGGSPRRSPAGGIAMESVLDALLTLSSKGQLVIPARLRQLLGLNPGDRLELSLEADGLLLKPHGLASSTIAWELIGCADYQGPPISLDQQDPALYATKALP